MNINYQCVSRYFGIISLIKVSLSGLYVIIMLILSIATPQYKKILWDMFAVMFFVDIIIMLTLIVDAAIRNHITNTNINAGDENNIPLEVSNA